MGRIDVGVRSVEGDVAVQTPAQIIRVAVCAPDPISEAGLRACFRGHHDLLVEHGGRPDVAVCAFELLDDRELDLLAATRGGFPTPVVLIFGNKLETHLVRLIELGVRSVVPRRDASPQNLVSVVRNTAQGESTLPGDLLGRLLSQVSMLQETVLAPRGLHLSGLTDRELDVLRLVAEGFDTGYIARKLSYSERTVKNILQEITVRLGLRNRTHAVSFALRHGLI